VPETLQSQLSQRPGQGIGVHMHASAFNRLSILICPTIHKLTVTVYITFVYRWTLRSVSRHSPGCHDMQGWPEEWISSTSCFFYCIFVTFTIVDASSSPLVHTTTPPTWSWRNAWLVILLVCCFAVRVHMGMST